MSPGGTTGTLVEAIADTATPAGVTEGTVTIKKPLASRNRIKYVTFQQFTNCVYHVQSVLVILSMKSYSSLVAELNTHT